MRKLIVATLAVAAFAAGGSAFAQASQYDQATAGGTCPAEPSNHLMATTPIPTATGGTTRTAIRLRPWCHRVGRVMWTAAPGLTAMPAAAIATGMACAIATTVTPTTRAAADGTPSKKAPQCGAFS